MAETRYEIGLLNYHCDTYESAIDFLNNWGKHKPGQPVCVFYGSEDTGWRVLFAVGSSETDGNKYNILGEVSADDLNEKIQWFSLDEEGNIKTDGNTLRLVHNLNEEDDIETLASNNENVLFVKTGDGIGCIYHNGILYASPYIDDKVLKEDLTHGETTYPAGTSLTAILTDILEKIGTGNIKVSWDNIENIPANVEDAFNCDVFMKKDNNLSDVGDKKLATENLLGGLDGINNNTVLKFENGVIKWGGAIVGWYDKSGGLLPGTEVKFTNITREEYEGLTTPDTSTLYFVYSGSGVGTTYELFIGPHSLKTNAYFIEEASEKPEDVEKRYVLKDSAGVQSGVAIDIPKDKFVTHAELKTVVEPNVPYEGAKVGDEYIDLEIMNCQDHIYIPIGDLDIPQSDWNENDTTKEEYVKNRTHWVEFIDHNDILCDSDAEVSYYNEYTSIAIVTWIGEPIQSREELDRLVIKYDGTEILHRTTTYQSPTRWWVSDNYNTFGIGFGVAPGYHYELYGGYVGETLHFEVKSIWTETVYHKIDEHYIPDTIARQSTVDTLIGSLDSTVGIASIQNDIVTLKQGITQTDGLVENNGEQDIELAKVAKTGSYNDLLNKIFVKSDTTNLTQAMNPNTLYVWTTALVEGNILAPTLVAATATDIISEYMGKFTTGATVPTLNFPDNIVWQTGIPTLQPLHTYEFSIMDNIGIFSPMGYVTESEVQTMINANKLKWTVIN